MHRATISNKHGRRLASAALLTLALLFGGAAMRAAEIAGTSPLPPPPPVSDVARLSVLTNLQQLAALPEWTAKLGLPVQIDAWASFYRSNPPTATLLDNSGQVALPGNRVTFPFGKHLRVAGKTAWGKGGLKLDDQQIEVLEGENAPWRITAGQLLSASDEQRWANVEGVVEMINPGAGRLIFQMADGHDHFELIVQRTAMVFASSLLHKRITAHGLVKTVINGRGERVLGHLWVPNLRQISLVKPSIQDWLNSPLVSLKSLAPAVTNRATAANAYVEGQGALPSLRRGALVHVAGTVSKPLQAGSIWLSQGDETVTVYTSQTNDFAKGTQLEALGVVGSLSGRLALFSAYCRAADAHALTNGSAPLPTLTSIEQVLRLRPDEAARGYPVKIRGVVTLTRTNYSQYIHDASHGIFFWCIGPLEFAPADFLDLHGLVEKLRTQADPVSAWLWQRFAPGTKAVLADNASSPAVILPALIAELNQVIHGEPLEGVLPLDKALLSPETLGMHALDRQGDRQTLLNLFMLQDAFPNELAKNHRHQSPSYFKLGGRYELEGRTAPGQYAPRIELVSNVKFLGMGQLPEPARPTWEILQTGSQTARWVEIEGIVRSVAGSELTIGMMGGPMRVLINDSTSENTRKLVDSIVRLRGVCRPVFDTNRQLIESLIHVPSPQFISVEDPPLSDPFSLPCQSVAEVEAFSLDATRTRWIKVQGQVVCLRKNTGYLLEDDKILKFELRRGLSLRLGQRVELVGLPDATTRPPMLRSAIGRTLGLYPLPPSAPTLNLRHLMEQGVALARVQVRGELLTLRTNADDAILEIHADSKVVIARLDNKMGTLPFMRPGSEVELIGIYEGQVNALRTPFWRESFEVLVPAPASLRIIREASWWTLGHSLTVMGVLGCVLLVALAWIFLLRRRVRERTASLEQRTRQLEAEIHERRRVEREVEKAHQQLLLSSRLAGMAEVATSVLHNVGNVLNSVNISATVVADVVSQLRPANLGKAVDLLSQNAAVPNYLTTDEKGRKVHHYLASLPGSLTSQQTRMLSELGSLRQNIDHIKEIVTRQQEYSRLSGVVESIKVTHLLEDALQFNTAAMVRHEVHIIRDLQTDVHVMVDKHKVLQILVNLLRNAKYACDEGGQLDKRLTLRTVLNGKNRVQIQVIDNGIGIKPENMAKIFTQGFTTRKDGHGYGLHSSAIAAKELGGSLTVHSDGPGKGAAFTLEIPVPPPAEK